MRLLIWNIESFTLSRISDFSGNTMAEQADNLARSQANFNYVLNTIRQGDPDVFVIIEARCAQGNIEQLADGDGPLGLLMMLNNLRAFHSNQWCLVPPLRVNPRDQLTQATHTETVGVFWRNDRLQFTGPYVWPAAAVNSGPPVPPGAMTANYPPPWNAVVPPGTTAAARCRFYNANQQEILFATPQSAVAPYTRRPFLTTFTERAGMLRTIKLFSVHTKPGINARDAMFQMVGMQPADWEPGNNEVTVFAGDFNLNLLARNTMDNEALQQFTNNRLGLLLPDFNNQNPRTRVLRQKYGQPASYHENQWIDYGFVRYGAGATPNPLLQYAAVVVDRVAGVTPGGTLPAFNTDMAITLPNINLIAAANWVNILAVMGAAQRVGGVTTITTAVAHGLPVGAWVFVNGVGNGSFNGPFQVMATPNANTFTYAQPQLANANSGGGAVNTQPQMNTFRQRQNFGHITRPRAGTSDHLPIFMIV